MSPLFVSACFSQGDAVCSVRVPAVNPVPVQGRHQRDVEGPAGCPRKETTLPPRLPAFCHLQRRTGGPNPGLARQCSWRPVLTLPTDLSNNILHCKSPAAQDPDCRTRCSVHEIASAVRTGQLTAFQKSNGGVYCCCTSMLDPQ